MDIERAYRQIRRKCEKCNVKLKEDLAVVKKVEEYRQFWRPQKVKVVLLAESHKYTCNKLLSHRADYSRIKRYTKFLKGCPTKYVKFVYCLGYGENELLKNPVKGNKGTWQFWEVLYSCNISKISDKSVFDPILKTTSTFDERILQKVELLQSLKKKGIWLVDVSVTGVDKKERELILKTSWQYYTRDLLLSLKKKKHLKHIIVIGKGLLKHLKQDISGEKLLGIPFTSVCQPQGCRENGKLLDELKKINNAVKKYS